MRGFVALPLLAAGVATVWWFFWTSPVRLPGDGGFGIVVGSNTSGQPYSVGSIPLCLDGAETAVVDSVGVDDGGLHVADFAVRPAPEPPRMALGSAPQSLRSTGFAAGRTITEPCDGGNWSELGVEFDLSTSATARTDVLEVRWSAGIRSGTLLVPMQFVLCGSEDTLDPDCAGSP